MAGGQSGHEGRAIGLEKVGTLASGGGGEEPLKRVGPGMAYGWG